MFFNVLTLIKDIKYLTRPHEMPLNINMIVIVIRH